MTSDFEIAKGLKQRIIRIYVGVKSCPKPRVHEHETHWGTHKHMKKPEWLDLKICINCNYFLAQSMKFKQVICGYEVE